jgi:hypothetical protein
MRALAFRCIFCEGGCSHCLQARVVLACSSECATIRTCKLAAPRLLFPTTRGIHLPATASEHPDKLLLQIHCFHAGTNACNLQVEAVPEVTGDAAALLVRLEALQEIITNVACLHRVFFQRLVCHARTQSGSADVALLPQNDSDQADHEHALNMFLEHHFLSDSLMQELQVWPLSSGCAQVVATMCAGVTNRLAVSNSLGYAE